MPRLPSPLDVLTSLASAVARRAGASAPEAAPETVEPAFEAPAVADAPRTPGRVGKYDERLATLVAGRPGVTVAQAAAEIGVHPTALYPVIRRLEARRRLVKLGRELQPVSAARVGGPERLWCVEGHWWTRPRARGRKPARCPRHR